MLLFSKGSIVHTHPQLLQAVSATFPKLTPDRFKHAVGLFWLPPKEVDHTPFGKMADPRLAALNYFFCKYTTEPERCTFTARTDRLFRRNSRKAFHQRSHF